MQWYVSHQGSTIGPHDGQVLHAKIQEMVAGGQSLAGAYVRDDAGAWMPIEQSPFASALRPPTPHAVAVGQAATPTKTPPKWLVGGITIVLLGWMVTYFDCAGKKGQSVSAAPSNPTVNKVPDSQLSKPEPPKQREPTLAEKLAAETRVSSAVALLQPMMTDTVNEMSPGAAALALWSAKNLTWADLQTVPETKRSMVMKDPEAERGKRLCSTGTINEIQVDRTGGSPVYVGGMLTPGYDSVRFMAVGSTGALVENSGARLCGVVSGRFSYSNAAGGTTHAVQVVGMFDLPENKRKPAAAGP